MAVPVRIPLVLWGVYSGIAARGPLDGTRVTVLPREVEITEVRTAITALTTSGSRLRRPSASPAVPPADLERVLIPGHSALAPHAPSAAQGGTVIALVGAPGGQGVSMLAAGLTAALGRKGPAALVDLNLERPSQALALDLNPARNLYMVLHEAGAQNDSALWARLAIEQPVGACAARRIARTCCPAVDSSCRGQRFNAKLLGVPRDRRGRSLVHAWAG